MEWCVTDSKRGCFDYVSRVGSGGGKGWVVVLVGREHLLAEGRKGGGKRKRRGRKEGERGGGGRKGGRTGRRG